MNCSVMPRWRVSSRERVRVMRFYSLALGVVADDILFGRYQFGRQGLLQSEQPAPRKQFGIPVDLGEQALLRRNGKNMGGIQFENRGRAAYLPGNFLFDLRIAAYAIPQPVDLVEHGDAALLPGARAVNVVAPDGEI